MKKRILLICVICAMISTAYPVKHDDYEQWGDFLHRRMLLLAEHENLPNAVVALVTKEEIKMLQGYGYADIENEIHVDPQVHLFRSGSVSKIFTWTAIMQLYESGLVDLDADIHQYMDIRLSFPIRYKTREHQPITLNHLLSHSAGFANTFKGVFSFSQQPSLKDFLLKNKPDRIYPPGEVMAYSNYGTTLAGYIVECVTGMSFEDYVEEHIFAPAGMNNSTFRQPLPGHLKDQMVQAYRWREGEYHKGQFEHMPAPAGGVSTTAHDMALFMMAHLNEENNSLLDSQTLKKMHASLFSYHPLTTGMAHGMMSYTINGQRIVEHSGSSTIFDAGFYLFPELEAGIFIAYSGGNYLGHATIVRAFLDEFFPDPKSDFIDYAAVPAPYFPILIEGEYRHSLRITRGMDKILNLAFGSMQVQRLDNNRLKVTVYDASFLFEQVAPGIYKNIETGLKYPYGPMHYLVASKAPDGRMMLVSDGPASFIKATWYESSIFSAAIFLPALLLAIGSLLFFVVRYLIRKFRKKACAIENKRRILHRFMGAHAVLFLLIIMLLLNHATPHPVHLMPESFFGANMLMVSLIGLFTYMIAAAGVSISFLTVKAWKNDYGTLAYRIYYSIHSIWAVALIWLLFFYNLHGMGS
jgi:CubicO group peptidase (beta-lactamase class C family)